MSFTAIVYATLVVVTAIAGFTDLRSGLIPNRLTLPVLLAAPLLHGVVSGWDGVIRSLMGILICSLMPLVFFALGATGGGDVKLFAALGALGGPWIGLEIEFVSMGLAAFWSLCTLAYRGLFWRSLANSGKLLINGLLPKRRRLALDTTEFTTLRIGGAIFVATVLAVVSRGWFGAPLLGGSPL